MEPQMCLAQVLTAKSMSCADLFCGEAPVGGDKQQCSLRRALEVKYSEESVIRQKFLNELRARV